MPSSPVNVYYFSAIEKKIKVLLGIVPNPASNCGKICIYWCNYTPFKRVQIWSVPRLQFHFGKIPPEKIGSRSGFEPVTVPDMDINTSIRLGESETRLSQKFRLFVEVPVTPSLPDLWRKWCGDMITRFTS